MWTALPPMPDVRVAAVAAFLKGKLYVVGGIDMTNTLAPRTDIYDPTSNTWSVGVASMPLPLTQSALAVPAGAASNPTDSSTVATVPMSEGNFLEKPDIRIPLLCESEYRAPFLAGKSVSWLPC